jgi:hypothetical protein
VVQAVAPLTETAAKAVSRTYGIREMEMNASGAVALDTADLIKWWNALDLFGPNIVMMRGADVAKALQLARESRHPDAVWLASLFPAGVAVTQQRMVEVMSQQGDDDPRALLLGWQLGSRASDEPLRRAAEMGYAPAQAELSKESRSREEQFASGRSGLQRGRVPACNVLLGRTRVRARPGQDVRAVQAGCRDGTRKGTGAVRRVCVWRT